MRYFQAEAANERFIKLLLKRHGGDAKAALEEVKKLRAMNSSGQVWWTYIAGKLAFLIAEGLTK